MMTIVPVWTPVILVTGEYYRDYDDDYNYNRRSRYGCDYDYD